MLPDVVPPPELTIVCCLRLAHWYAACALQPLLLTKLLRPARKVQRPNTSRAVSSGTGTNRFESHIRPHPRPFRHGDVLGLEKMNEEGLALQRVIEWVVLPLQPKVQPEQEHLHVSCR